MNGRLSVFQLTVRDDLSEVIAYTSPNVPIRAVVGTLSHFPNKAAVCHWHSELEFIIVLEGEMHYFVNEKVYRRIQQQLKMTAIYVTHDQEEALAISDRIAVMAKGKIEQLDQP